MSQINWVADLAGLGAVTRDFRSGLAVQVLTMWAANNETFIMSRSPHLHSRLEAVLIFIMLKAIKLMHIICTIQEENMASERRSCTFTSEAFAKSFSQAIRSLRNVA